MGRGASPTSPARLQAALDDLRHVHRQASELRDKLAAEGLAAQPITPDHPLVKAVGLEREIAAVLAQRPAADRCPSGLTQQDREERAALRRSQVLALSLAKKTVAQIATEMGLHYRYVVQLRAQLGVGRIRDKR